MNRFIVMILAAVAWACCLPCASGQSVELASTVTVGPAKRRASVDGIALTHDSKRLAVLVSLSDPTATGLATYDTRTGKELRRQERMWGGQQRVRYTQDGKSIVFQTGGYCHVSRTSRNVVQVLDAETLEARWSANLSKAEAQAVFPTPDGKRLVCVGAGHVLILDAATGKGMARFPALRCPLAGEPPAALSPDGSLLALASNKGWELAVYDLAQGKEVAQIGPPKKADARLNRAAACFTPDGKALASWSDGIDGLCLHDPRTGGVLSTHALASHPKCEDARFTADGKALVFAGRFNCPLGVAAADLASGRTALPVQKGPDFSPSYGAISGDGSMAAVARSNGPEVRVYNIDTKKDE